MATVKSCTFMIDGICPQRGPQLRCCAVTTALHGRKLSRPGCQLTWPYCDRAFQGRISGAGRRQQGHDLQGTEQEEDKFNKTIDQGLSILNDRIADMQAKGEDPGRRRRLQAVRHLRLPLDLTREILEEKGYGVDEDGFAAAMKEQKDKARMPERPPTMGADVMFTVHRSRHHHGIVGYANLTAESKITVSPRRTRSWKL